MSLAAAQLIASAETCGEALRRLRVARDLTQADLVERSVGTIGVDQISLLERGKRPMLSRPCTAIAKALGLTDEDAAQLMLLALIDRAPERLKPILRRPRLGLRLQPFEALLTACPQGQLHEGIATLDTIAELWPHVKRGERTPQPEEGQGLRSTPLHHQP
jgi:transcriptional regulator with XRE-family HTH domain